ncbi:MAG TPA: sensor domain-containing diguanylate cyclase, partial [Acidiferrobacteraceae bacterium]|nr:sensor domain-containing diguanylate cyclase [Acidiferrobacteraceae bacterium]
VVAVVLLGLAGIAGQHALDGAEARSQREGQNLRQARRTARELTETLWRVQDLQQQRLLAATSVPAPALTRARARLETAAHERWAQDFAAGPLLLTARTDLATLHRRLQHLRALQANPAALYPDVTRMHRVMYPQSTAILKSLARLERRLQADPTPGSAAQRQRVQQALTVWRDMIAAFRMRMAFSRTVYPHAVQPLAHDSVRRDYAAFERILRVLRAHAARLPEHSEARTLQRVSQRAQDWHQALLQILRHNRYRVRRADLPYIHDQIQPVVATLWQHAVQLRALAEAHSHSSAVRQISTIRTLSHYLWLLGAFAVAKILFTSLMLERSVRRPMARLAQAMHAEAQGRPGPPLPTFHAREPLELIAAFQVMQHQVHSRQQRLEAILDHAAEGILTFREDGMVESINLAASRLLGYSSATAVGMPLGKLLDIGNTAGDGFKSWLEYCLTQPAGRELEVVGLHQDGGRTPLCIHLSRAVLESGPLYTALLSDVTERKAMLAHLRQLAERDPLTGLFNRIYLETELDRVVERTRRHPQLRHALIYLDLDNFKYVNETLGHIAGDRLLVAVTGVLQSRTRKSDLLARFGGDEFAILLYNTDAEQAGQVADSFRRQLAAHRFVQEGRPVDIRGSAGIAVLSAESQSGAEVLSQADMACDRAKLDGKNRVHLFSSPDHERIRNMSNELGWAHRIR